MSVEFEYMVADRQKSPTMLIHFGLEIGSCNCTYVSYDRVVGLAQTVQLL